MHCHHVPCSGDSSVSYVRQVLISFDQFLNAVAGGWADETLSARSYRLSGESRGWLVMMRVIDTLFFWQVNHCFMSYQMEVIRHHLPPEYRVKGEEGIA